VKRLVAKLTCISALTLCCLTSASAYAATGEVYKRISGCDYFVVSSARGYALLEWYGGSDPDKGDTVSGVFETYGMHTLRVNDDEDDTVKVWVEEYWLTRSDALDQLVDKCE
jgi:hypothetical protein